MARFSKTFMLFTIAIIILLLTYSRTTFKPETINTDLKLMKDGRLHTHMSGFSTQKTEFNAQGPPSLPPGYKTETLTRLGTDLNFDLRTCPPGSIMTNPKHVNTPPVHSDCPRLFVAGARKGGSTSMIQYVSKHPDFKGAKLNGPNVGEVFFFMSKYYKPESMKQWRWYLSNFPKGVITGESSVGYMVHCLVPERIFWACGKQAKIVMLLRDPVDRFVSNFLMRVRVPAYGNKITKSTPITSVIQEELKAFLNRTSKLNPATLTQNWRNLRCTFQQSENMIFEGLYYIHLSNWLCNFPAENILLINSEEMYQNTSTIMKQVFLFLGLKPMPENELNKIGTHVYNKGKYGNIPDHQQLSTSDKQLLQNTFEPYNKALLKLLQWKKTDWVH